MSGCVFCSWIEWRLQSWYSECFAVCCITVVAGMRLNFGFQSPSVLRAKLIEDFRILASKCLRKGSYSLSSLSSFSFSLFCLSRSLWNWTFLVSKFCKICFQETKQILYTCRYTPNQVGSLLLAGLPLVVVCAMLMTLVLGLLIFWSVWLCVVVVLDSVTLSAM